MSDATKLRDSALAAIAKARDDSELEAIEVEYLGRRDSKISRQLLSGIAQLDPSQRATLGQEANEAKRAVEAALPRVARHDPGPGAHRHAADLHHRAGPRVPPRQPRRDSPSLLHAAGGTCRRRGPHGRRPERHAAVHGPVTLRSRAQRANAAASLRLHRTELRVRHDVRSLHGEGM